MTSWGGGVPAFVAGGLREAAVKSNAADSINAKYDFRMRFKKGIRGDVIASDMDMEMDMDTNKNKNKDEDEDEDEDEEEEEDEDEDEDKDQFECECEDSFLCCDVKPLCRAKSDEVMVNVI